MNSTSEPLEGTMDLIQTVTVALYVVLAILIAYTAIRGFRRWRERRAAARGSRSQHLAWRGDFIGALIEMVGQDTQPTKRLRKLRKVLGWNDGQARLVLDSLRAKGLVERVVWGSTGGDFTAALGMWVGGVRVRLTEAGLDEAERAQNGPTENLPRIVAYRSIVTVSRGHAIVNSPGAFGRDTAVQSPGAFGEAVAIASPQSTQSLVKAGLDPELLIQWIEAYREALTDATPLSPRSTRHAEALLAELEDAARVGDSTRVEGLGQTLRAIAEGVAGNAAFETLVKLAERLFGP